MFLGGREVGVDVGIVARNTIVYFGWVVATKQVKDVALVVGNATHLGRVDSPPFESAFRGREVNALRG